MACWRSGRREKGLEKGQRIRLDSTAVESDIHHPTDSSLLYDAVRTVSRLLGQLKERQGELQAEGQAGGAVLFTNHRRRAKRRAYQIANTRGAKRQRAYRDLLKVARKTYGYGRAVLARADLPVADVLTVVLLCALEHYLTLMAQVIDQTERRVLGGESVPAAQKVVSIFEEHTDIIKKGQREPTYGHKIFLTCGPSSLITSCAVLPGNPADVGQFQPLLEAHRDVYGRYPRQIAADRGFYSQANLSWAKGEGIVDAAFDRKGHSGDRRYGELQLDLQTVETFSRWHRRVHLVGQARLRAGPLHLERLGALPAVCAGLRGQLQPAGPGPLASLKPRPFFLTQPTRY